VIEKELKCHEQECLLECEKCEYYQKQAEFFDAVRAAKKALAGMAEEERRENHEPNVGTGGAAQDHRV
jgi:hypothetical protein